MRRIVLDTSVLVSAFRNRNGSSFRIVELIDRRELIALASTSLFLEYEAVLKRPEQLAATQLSSADVDLLLGALAALVEPVAIWFQWRPQLDDANDEMVLEAAINGRADAIVTFNTADFTAGAAMFNIRIMTPAAFLKEFVR